MFAIDRKITQIIDFAVARRQINKYISTYKKFPQRVFPLRKETIGFSTFSFNFESKLCGGLRDLLSE